MKKELLDMISNALGVKDVVINSSLVSAQNRHRHYWCNWEVAQPEDKGILLRDIVVDGFDTRNKSQTILSTIYKENAKTMVKRNKMGLVVGSAIQELNKNQTAIIKVGNVNPSGNGMNGNVYALEGKAPTVTTNKGEGSKVLCGAMRGRYIVDGKRQDHKMKTAGLTEQRLEVRNDGKTNTLTTVQKDNVVVYSVNDNDRVGGITENERGFRPHKADSVKSGISELGRILKTNSKTDTLTTSHSPKVVLNNEISDLKYRKLTPLECERLQTFPDNWTDCISNTQRYKSLGNSWTVDVIAHIFKEMNKRETV